MTQISPLHRRYLLLVAILLLVIFYLVKCKGKEYPKDITPIPVIRERVKTDSIASKKYKDSVNKIVSYWEGQAKHWEDNWHTEVKTTAGLQEEMGNWLNSQVPDTCEQYKQKALQEYAKLVKANSIKDNSCSQTITAKNRIIEQKDVLIKKGAEDYTKLRSNLDTCFKNQTSLEQYAKSLKPSRELILAVSGMQSYANNFSPSAGIGVGYRNKRGLQIDASIYSNKIVTLSIRKPLIRF